MGQKLTPAPAGEKVPSTVGGTTRIRWPEQWPLEFAATAEDGSFLLAADAMTDSSSLTSESAVGISHGSAKRRVTLIC
jgi:hypothetical protein